MSQIIFTRAYVANYYFRIDSKPLRGAFSLTELMDIGKDVDRKQVSEACENVDLDDGVIVVFTSVSILLGYFSFSFIMDTHTWGK